MSSEPDGRAGGDVAVVGAAVDHVVGGIVVGGARFGESGSPNRAWIASVDGQAAANATLHVGGGVAGIYGVVTRPEGRRLGLARHLTTRALTAAHAAGASTAVLHSSPMAVDLCRAIGFQPVADFQVFAPPDTPHL